MTDYSTSAEQVFINNFQQKIHLLPYSESKSWLRRVYYYKSFQVGKNSGSHVIYEFLCFVCRSHAGVAPYLQHGPEKSFAFLYGNGRWTQLLKQHYLLLWDLNRLLAQTHMNAYWRLVWVILDTLLSSAVSSRWLISGPVDQCTVCWDKKHSCYLRCNGLKIRSSKKCTTFCHMPPKKKSRSWEKNGILIIYFICK